MNPGNGSSIFKHYSLDSKDDFRSDSDGNVSHEQTITENECCSFYLRTLFFPFI